jgi:hypothetical protein
VQQPFVLVKKRRERVLLAVVGSFLLLSFLRLFRRIDDIMGTMVSATKREIERLNVMVSTIP